MTVNHPVRVRFAPSPTGSTHLGSGRTALYNYLLARQTGGKFILRIEDTDQRRYIPEAEQELCASLRWLGLDWDEGPDVGGPFGPYRQSERKEIYLKYARQLIEQGNAYYCFCSPERLSQIRQERQKQKLPQSYDGLCRNIPVDEAASRVAAGESHVIRFKMPTEGTITVQDELRGAITVENRLLDDFILLRSDELPVYHLAVVIDDHLMKISHVFRGSEWLPTLPLHAHITRAFGWQEPKWIHLSIFLKPSGKGKMSKREASNLIQDGYSIYIKDLQQLGYLPDAVVNWIALMGWSYDDKTEIFSINDLIEKFNISSLNPSPAAINYTKLDYFNGIHIRQLNDLELARRIKPYFVDKGYSVDDDRLLKIAPIIKERLVTLDDAPELAGFFFSEEINPLPEELIGKNMSINETLNILAQVLAIIQDASDVTQARLELPLREYVERSGYTAGQVFGIIRVAVTGKKVSPPLFESIEIMEKVRVVSQLQNAISLLKNYQMNVPDSIH